MTYPWIVVGDFNDVLEQNERIGRRAHKRITGEFRECVEKCGIEDLKASGCYYTWYNKQDIENRVWAKLDRAMVNQIWGDQFADTEAVFMPEGRFDHSPILITSFKGQ